MADKDFLILVIYQSNKSIVVAANVKDVKGNGELLNRQRGRFQTLDARREPETYHLKTGAHTRRGLETRSQEENPIL
jgi:hypothetical protein